MPTSRCPTLICSGRGSKVIAFQSGPRIIIQAIHFLSVVCDHILNTELMHESQRGDKCVRLEILIFMIDAICSFSLLSSLRTCQGGSGPGTDAGAEHSDGVSEQNEGMFTHIRSDVCSGSSTFHLLSVIYSPVSSLKPLVPV